ncbi:hypothetical protein QP157_00210 [Sphingomonas sp. LR61]
MSAAAAGSLPAATCCCTAAVTCFVTAASAASFACTAPSFRPSCTFFCTGSTIFVQIWSITPLFSDAFATEGVSAALRALFRSVSFCIAAVMFVGIRVNRTDSSTAVPMVPPICRKNVAALVATPMSRGDTEFCAARVSVCMSCPSPRPMPNMPSIRNQRGRSAVRNVRTVKPMAVNAVPVIGKTW